MRQPTVRRTWAPRGQTPILKSDDRRDRLSAISALTVSPKRRRLGLYFDILDHNVKTDDFEQFVERLLRRIRRPIILVIDRYSVHRSAAKRLLARHRKRLSIEWLPALRPGTQPRRTGVEPYQAHRPGQFRARRRRAPGMQRQRLAQTHTKSTKPAALLLEPH